MKITKPRLAALAAVLVLPVALAACGSGHPAPIVTRTVTAAPSAPAAQAGPGSTPVVQTVREGQPFRLSYQENGVMASWKITLGSLTCGSAGIFDPKVMAAYYDSMGEAPATPRPHVGMQFCLVKFSVVNEGESNQPWMASDATVNVGMDAYQDNAF
jgi:hypothetical protein